MNHDPVNHPAHYYHASGIECIEITGEMSFALGNAFKYLFRCNAKGNSLQDIKKALYYLNYEWDRRNKASRWWKQVWWWLTNELKAAALDGPYPIKQVLSFESRYSGHMAAALAAIYDAEFYNGGPVDVKRAIRAVNHVLTLEQEKQS